MDGDRHLGGRLHDRAEAGRAVRHASAAEHHVHRPALRRRSEHEPARRALPGGASERAVPDHEIRAVRPDPRGLQGMRQRRLRRRPPAPVLPDEPADEPEPEQALRVDGRHRRRLQRRAPGRHRPGRRVDGLLQRPARRRAGVRLPGEALLDVRQLPPGGDGRNRHEPRRPRQRPGCLVRERGGSTADAAGEPDREPERPARVEQLLHPGRLRGRDVLQVLRPVAAGRRRGHRLPACQLARRLVGVRAGHVLHAEQLQPGLPRQRHQGPGSVRGPAAEPEDVSDHRGRAEHASHQLGLLRPGLERGRPQPRAVLQHLQPVPVRDVDHDRRRRSARRTCTASRCSRPRPGPARCRPSRS